MGHSESESHVTTDGELATHSTLWTPSKISRYWDCLSKQPHALANCWSKQVGGSLIRYVGRRVPLRGRILDFGCGPGFLIEELVLQAPDAEIVGVDSSPESISAVRARFRDAHAFKGAFTLGRDNIQLRDGTFDMVFFVETIEHLLPQQQSDLIRSLLQLLRPGGVIVLTTPNNEDLDQSMVLCPDCGAVFHKIQHLSAWTSETLRQMMEACGFETRHCKPIHLRAHFSLTGWMKDLITPRYRLPHLVYFGSRPSQTVF